MPPKHEHEHDRKPKHPGPKERELAVTLTVAVIHAAKTSGSVEQLGDVAIATYRKFLAALDERPEATG